MYSTLHVFNFAHLQAYMHTKIDDVETLVQRTCGVRTRHEHQAHMHVRCIHAKACLRAPWRVYEA